MPEQTLGCIWKEKLWYESNISMELNTSAHLRCSIHQEVLHPSLLQSLVFLVDDFMQQLGVELGDARIHAVALFAQGPYLHGKGPLLLELALELLKLFPLPL